MLNYNNNNITNVFYGAIPLSKIYYGTNLVWQKEQLPDSYLKHFDLKLNEKDIIFSVSELRINGEVI